MTECHTGALGFGGFRDQARALTPTLGAAREMAQLELAPVGHRSILSGWSDLISWHGPS